MSSELSVKNNFGVVESVNGGTVVVDTVTLASLVVSVGREDVVDETSGKMDEVKGTVVELASVVVVTVTGVLVEA